MVSSSLRSEDSLTLSSCSRPTASRRSSWMKGTRTNGSCPRQWPSCSGDCRRCGLGWRGRVPAEPKRRGTLPRHPDRKSTRLNSSHDQISYAVFCLKKKKVNIKPDSDLASKGVGAQVCNHSLGTTLSL